MEIPTGQGVFDMDLEATLSGLNAVVTGSRLAWERHAFEVPGRPHVIADAHVLAGAPTIKGTRVETALVLGFAVEGTFDDDTVARIQRSYPRLSDDAILDAFRFEGVTRRVA